MADIRNAPRDTDQTWHKMPWPEVGGGGSRDLEVSQDELFQRMAEWKKVDYLVGAGTKGESDSNRTGGLVDNHAYAVMKVVMNAAGTGIDLAEVRNPWGRGEIEDGEFGDEGHGWEKYPEIKNLLKPRVANDVTARTFRQNDVFQCHLMQQYHDVDMSAYYEDTLGFEWTIVLGTPRLHPAGIDLTQNPQREVKELIRYC
eukprot:scaffold8150_cov118-Cylindrotheca_fusiformis.AAC.2